jgi:hypothetical protein
VRLRFVGGVQVWKAWRNRIRLMFAYNHPLLQTDRKENFASFPITPRK